MQLPDDVLILIREYSKPLTRPDWRTLRPLSSRLLYHELYTILCNSSIPCKVYKRVFNNLINTQWGETYLYIRMWGIQDASVHFKKTIHELCQLSNMEYAQHYYEHVQRTYRMHPYFQCLK
jgi:hypothetical protein